MWALITSVNGRLSRAGWIGGENDSSIPQGSLVLKRGRSEIMCTPCPESSAPVEKATSIGVETTSSGSYRLAASSIAARAISTVVIPSCLIAPSMVALISAYP